MEEFKMQPQNKNDVWGNAIWSGLAFLGVSKFRLESDAWRLGLGLGAGAWV